MASIVACIYYSSAFSSAAGVSELFSLSCSAAARAALASASIYRSKILLELLFH